MIVKNEYKGDKRRKQILEFIVNYVKLHGYSPTLEEICKGVGLNSKASAHYQIKQMIGIGMLETDVKTIASRALRVPGYKFVKDPNYKRSL